MNSAPPDQRRSSRRARDGAPPAATTDWLRTSLTVSGPAAAVARFRDAARGTGAVPWHLDLDHEEARLLAPMAAAGIEARLLARELREIIAGRHERSLTHWSRPGRCPLDLNRLIPVPGAILQRGEDSSAARAWLWSHWGTTQPLRQVRIIAKDTGRRLRRSARTTFEFRSADWTPWQAIAQLRRDFPQLIFVAQPHYDDA